MKLPRYTHTAALCGHHVATVDFRGKRALVSEFFAPGTSEARRQELLARFGVRYVVASVYDHRHAGFQPGSSPSLERAFQNEVATVYRVLGAR